MEDLYKELSVVISQEDDWTYFAEVKLLPGCFTMWNNLDELWINLKEAIVSYLSSIQKDIKKYDFKLDTKKLVYA